MKKFFFILSAAVIVLLIVALVLLLIYVDNKTIGITQYSISNDKIPVEFDGYRIVQVADLHNTEFGEDNEQLLSLIAQCEPDIIVFTGDQLDSRTPDKAVVLDLVSRAVQIAPCYLVTGNHEGRLSDMEQFHEELEDAGVVYLDNEIVPLSRNGAEIQLIGLTNHTLNQRYYTSSGKLASEVIMEELGHDQALYSVLLVHKPDYLDLYERTGFDLVLCGHVHGGQVRINGQGLIAPGQKLFPEYDAGVYTLNKTTMVLSRGLGNSAFPWRINNPPELVLVELHTER